MSQHPDKFVDVGRTFHELALYREAGTEGGYRRRLGLETKVLWSDLTDHHRVVLLANAGAGKTTEILHQAQRLHNEGASAFFVRLENVVAGLEDSFEVGTHHKFQEWIASGAEGWLFLDSVDEARLKGPKDFELAVRKIARLLSPVLQTCHIVITGRASAWRATSDLALCEKLFPFGKPKEGEKQVEDKIFEAVTEDEDDETDFDEDGDKTFLIVGLDKLHGVQIESFVRGQGISDPKPFLDTVARKDAWGLTTRPQDLSELVSFWKKNGEIGSRLQLMRNSIDRRLEERDQDRSEAKPLSKARVREAILLIAAATTLSQEPEIRVPDGENVSKGIAIKDILIDWGDVNCLTLLGRPIFSAEIYGTVRFHHRSVREYLTAEWLHGLMVDHASRRRIESLLFRVQYDLEVVVPTMRPILPWLALMDARILDRVCRLSPEVILEGGDPSCLPLEIRRQILDEVCEKLAQPARDHSFDDYAAVQRFADLDLTPDVRRLLLQYEQQEGITSFLLRMIWQGHLVDAADDAARFAVQSRSKYVRIAAFRALGAVGSPDALEAVRQAFLLEDDRLNRSWLAELIGTLPKNRHGLDWLLKALSKSADRNRHEIDELSDGLLAYISLLPMDLLPRLMEGLFGLIKEEPYLEKRHAEISVRFSWLAQQMAAALLRLIQSKDARAFSLVSLMSLRLLPASRDYLDSDHRKLREQIPAAVANWPDLNHSLFWFDVEECRKERFSEKGESLNDVWFVSIFGRFWSFTEGSFDRVCEDIASRELLDDRLVALTVAFSLYASIGRPRSWLAKLKRLAKSDQDLSNALTERLHPPVRPDEWRRRERHWKQKEDERKKKETANRLEWQRHIQSDIDSVRSGDKFNRNQLYLFQRLLEQEDRSGKWSGGGWRKLEPEFGRPIAEAFRAGAIAHWRKHRPPLPGRHHGDGTPYWFTFGLFGISIEASEDPEWIGKLSPEELLSAAHYALYELNGFPRWFPALFEAARKDVAAVLGEQIDLELAASENGKNTHGLLYDISWAGRWAFDMLGEFAAERLKATLANGEDVTRLLTILDGSSLPDATIAELASNKAIMTRDNSVAADWFATWVGVAPNTAIPAVASRLDGELDRETRTSFAMNFAVSLIGGRRRTPSPRDRFRTVDAMKAIYLLLNRHIHESEDIERAGTGVYSPGLRDDAQDARNSLFSRIKDVPGKAAYLALREISRSHPSEASRPWMAFHAKQKAAADADMLPWSPDDVLSFTTELERVPRNHRDLWRLAVDRLEDLKNELEEGDTSIASILQPVDLETEIRKYIGNWCKDRAKGRYIIPQEAELADKKRPDLSFQSIHFNGPVPAELKLADKWPGPRLFERLEIQLCGDYLRDHHSTRGIFLLVYHGRKSSWDLPNGTRVESFGDLCRALQTHWLTLASDFAGVEDIRVIGIDLTKRAVDTKTARGAGPAASSA
ncbi:HEAT repeat domain-containing protein [Rhizobium leguminosarum]|uniref:NACHT domain-containing protein n=1 Tax=Rhizobium leguminosarum TaxID=384 RepID=UPI001030AB3F|nr:HEAT repeat domain-containing protein [Rhizobium leguminosarum]TAY17128.1 HEAT repeat domain-containing protein [Rhizobium leguminosarum]